MKVLICDWDALVKLKQYGFEHNVVVERDLHELIDYFLSKQLKVIVSVSKPGSDYDYVLYVATRLL